MVIVDLHDSHCVNKKSFFDNNGPEARINLQVTIRFATFSLKINVENTVGFEPDIQRKNEKEKRS